MIKPSLEIVENYSGEFLLKNRLLSILFSGNKLDNNYLPSIITTTRKGKKHEKH